jgi:hypothetical protein
MNISDRAPWTRDKPDASPVHIQVNATTEKSDIRKHPD